MKALALKQTQDLAGKGRAAGAAKASVIAQRRSTFGPGLVKAPAIVDAGRPLDASTRTTMESGFGRDFSNIRVHDDARAHDNARELNAQAYSAGDHVVFGEGRYRPETSGGRALIAHELAHSVQQGGVQMKADGPLSLEADAELERQADRAAFDVTSGRSAPALSRIGRQAVFRAQNPPPGGTAVTAAPGPQQKLPADMVAIKDDPPGVGTTELVVALTNFSLPVEKGIGPWVKTAYDEAAAGKRLIFSPLIEGNKIAAYKEGSEDYKSIWLGKFGFSTTQGLALAFRSAAKTNKEVETALADKGVAALINGMSHSLKNSGCDIDHIVEKQVGGTSIPSNLQLLLSKKNQESGRETYQELVKKVEAIRDPTMRGPRVRKLQLQLQAATVPGGTTDPSFVVEDLLRKGAVKGSEAVKAAAEGSPVGLTAGGVGETVRIRDTGKTPIDSMAKRIVPGMRLVSYGRGATGAKSKSDKVEGELDSRAIAKTGSKTSAVMLNAELAPAGAAAPKAGDAPGSGAAATPGAEETPASETRVLKLDKAQNKKIDFYYPYLSPGYLTSVALDDNGNLTGEGIIKPSVKFLGDLKIRYGPDLLEMVAPIPADKLRAPIPSFRFTGGEIGLTLFPEFVPKGMLNFEIGPRGKPVLLGEVTAKYEAGAFVAIGTLKPGMKLPGISEASGEVLYHSEKGWSGKLEAKSSSFPGATNVTAKLGFTSDEGAFHPFGEGGINTKIKDADLFLKIGWRGGPVSYSGGVTVLKPLPLVDRVKLDGGYENDLLALSGDADIKWKSIAAKMHVVYRRRDGQEGKFSGKAGIEIKTEKDKALGHLDMEFNEAGDYWGKGEVSYQVTKDIRPKLGLELTKDHRVKVIGEVALADILLTKMWPTPEGGKIEFLKGVGAKFSVPTPVPAVTAYGEIKISAGLGYGVGPVMMKGIKFNGELYPLEDDPQIKARLTGKLAVPAYAELYGKFGAYIGVEVLLGAVGAKGGIDVKPTLGVKGEGGIEFDAQYESGGFSFDATAYAKGSMYATLAVDLSAQIHVAWGLFSHTWTHPVPLIIKPLGPELNITFGKVGYSRTGELTWPNPSQFDLNPKELDPLKIVEELLSEGKSKDREEARAKLKEMGFDVD